MIGLIVCGTTAIYSAGLARSGEVFHNLWIDHLTTAAFGLVVYFVLAFTDYRKYLGYLVWPSYLVTLALLAAVLVFGSDSLGGRRSLWFFQPAEIAKPCVIALVASLLGGRRGESFASFKGFALISFIIALPSALILLEPDLGTTLALGAACLAMLLVARVWSKGLFSILLLFAVVAFYVLGAVYEAEKPGTDPERRERILSKVPLKAHQLKRVKTFLFPEADIAGSGYNLHQAQITIGSGGVYGKGLKNIEMSKMKYLPQMVSINDFIFCVWAEGTGYVGSLTLLALYAALLFSCCWTAFTAEDMRGRFFALGTATLIFAHVYVNIAMSIGLVPITGIPLPFISQGRTFLVTVMLALGMVQSVALHREVEVER